MQAENKAKIKVPKPYVGLLKPMEFQNVINVREKSMTDRKLHQIKSELCHILLLSQFVVAEVHCLIRENERLLPEMTWLRTIQYPHIF